MDKLTPRNRIDGGSSSGSTSKDKEKGKQLVSSTPIPKAWPEVKTPVRRREEIVLLQRVPNDTAMPPALPEVLAPTSPGDGYVLHKSGWATFRDLLHSFKSDKKVDSDATALPAGSLCHLLQSLGMSPEIAEDELCSMLILSGYADAEGNLDFKGFLLFAHDFELLESIRRYNVASAKGDLDRGPLGYFFSVLESGEVLGFSHRDFAVACSHLNKELSNADCDSLKRYTDLHRNVSISFEQFLKVLLKEDGKKTERTDDTTLLARTYELDKLEPLGRILSFLASYSRSIT